VGFAARGGSSPLRRILVVLAAARDESRRSTRNTYGLSQNAGLPVVVDVSLLRTRSDIELLRAARGGEPEAFGQFFERYRDPITAYLIRRTRRPDLAADLVMESFAAVLVAVHGPDFNEPDNVIGWMFTIARNKLVDTARHSQVEDRARREAGLEPIEMFDSDLERISELTDEAHVVRMLERLPSPQRDAVKAHILDERDYVDIAAEASTSPMVIRQRVSRGLRRLRTLLEARQ
jgi:RNA polymerase sigma factor (sigma-70 family)